MIEQKQNLLQPASDDVGADPAAESSLPRTRSSAGVVVATLALLPERALLDEEALASALGVTKRTVRRMVARYELPPPVAFAGRSMWQVQKILGWFEERADRVARDAERAERRMNGHG